MNAIKIITAAALLAPAGTAVAQSQGDAKCVLVSTAFAKSSKDADSQKAAESAYYYYVGRIGDGMSAAQLKATFDAAAKTLTNENAGPTMDGCVKAIQTKMTLLQSISTPSQPTKPASPTQKKPEGR